MYEQGEPSSGNPEDAIYIRKVSVVLFINPKKYNEIFKKKSC